MPPARYANPPVLRRSEVATAVATGALTLVDPARVPPRLLPLYRVAVAGAGGAGIYAALENDRELAPLPAARAALALGVGGTMFATMGLWERVDASVSAAMRRRGVRHPRVKLAAASVLASLAVAALDNTLSRVLPADETVRADLSPELRALAEAILAETDDHSAPLLRSQLHHARAVGWAEIDELDGHLDLDIGTVTRWAVPHEFTFPVRAEFDHAGSTYAVQLRVDGGRLSEVLLEQVGFDPASDRVDVWPTRWPAVSEVRLRHDPVAPVPDGGSA